MHNLEKRVDDIAGIGGLLAWLINTAISAIVGLIIGLIIVAIVSRFHRDESDDAHPEPAH